MKRIFVAAIVFVLCVIPAVALAGQQQAVKEKPDPPDNAGVMRAQVFQVTNFAPSQLIDALKPLTSPGSSALIIDNNATKTISVRDFPENLAAIEAAIKILDKPASRMTPETRIDIDFQINLIAASNEGDDKDTGTPPALVPVVAQLRRTLGFKSYRFVTALAQRARSRGEASASGVIPNPFPTGPGAPQPAEYQFVLRSIDGTVTGTGPATLTVDRFSFSLMLPTVTNPRAAAAGTQAEVPGSQRLSISTSLALREGEQVVVGSSAAGVGNASIIVVLSFRRAGS